MNNPKCLADLKYTNSIPAPADKPVEIEANKYFHDLFDNSDPVHVNKLFTEDDCTVYEAYQDSDSDEYLYLIQKTS